MKRFFPFLSWLPTYNGKQFKGDLPAGLTVGIMLIPQGMAYALIAGLPLVYGLYAALVPQIVYAFMGTSRQLAVGPVAMDSLLVASGLVAIAAAKSDQYIALALLLALMMGVIQFGLGIFKLGFLVNFLSRPVISGFTSAAALIIGFNQLKYLLGVDIGRSNRVHELLVDGFQKMGEIHWTTFAIGAFGIALILLIKRINKKFKLGIPAALVVVIAGILAVRFMGPDGVSYVGEIPKGLPHFGIPSINFDDVEKLLPIAATLALIAFMEAISVAKAIQEKHGDYELDPNQELRALGLSNMIGSLFQAYPTTGGFSRTAVNDQAGARTGVAALISAGVVALTLLFLTPLFYHLPHAVLASIIMVAVFGLIDLKYPIQLWKSKKDELVLLLITFGITAGVGITQGIITGAVLSLIFMVFRTARPHAAVLGEIQGFYKNIRRFPEASIRPDMLILRFDGQLYYANQEYFRNTFRKHIEEKGEALKVVILNAESMNYIDASGGHLLLQLVREIRERGISFRLAGAIGPVRDTLKSMGLTDLIGEENYFIQTTQAVKDFDGEADERYQDLTTQTSD